MKDKYMNINKLKNDRKELELRIREVKAELRSPWTYPMGNVQTEHADLKREVTELYILRAWLRGKQHLADREFCKEVAERRMPEYKTVEVAAEVVAA